MPCHLTSLSSSRISLFLSLSPPLSESFFVSLSLSLSLSASLSLSVYLSFPLSIAHDKTGFTSHAVPFKLSLITPSLSFIPPPFSLSQNSRSWTRTKLTETLMIRRNIYWISNLDVLLKEHSSLHSTQLTNDSPQSMNYANSKVN